MNFVDDDDDDYYDDDDDDDYDDVDDVCYFIHAKQHKTFQKLKKNLIKDTLSIKKSWRLWCSNPPTGLQ